MNTGQMMIGIGAIALVVLTLLNFNRSSLTSQDALIYNKHFILSTSIAQSMIDEISSKAFDEEVVAGTQIISANNFSTLLSPEASESYPNFNDIDDYNNFSKQENVPGIGVFYVFVNVSYLNDSFVPTGSKTYNKEIKVRVTNPAFNNFYTNENDTLEISTFVSYWKLL